MEHDMPCHVHTESKKNVLNPSEKGPDGPQWVLGQEVAQGFLQGGMAESEPTVEGPDWGDPVGSEQGMGRFSIQQLDGESGHGRQHMGPAEDTGKCAAEFPLGHRIGRDRIDAALPGGVRQPLQDHLRQVVHMNPALPLGSRGEGRAESEAVQGLSLIHI